MYHRMFFYSVIRLKIISGLDFPLQAGSKLKKQLNMLAFTRRYFNFQNNMKP